VQDDGLCDVSLPANVFSYSLAPPL